jgi:hypothetical protein
MYYMELCMVRYCVLHSCNEQQEMFLVYDIVLVGEWFVLTLWNIKDNCQTQHNIPEDLTPHFFVLNS